MQLDADFVPAPVAVLTGNELGIDRWILSRLAYCVETCTEGFQNYEFPTITTAIYNFWLYELCDVYLEAIKPVSLQIGKMLHFVRMLHFPAFL